MLQKIKEKIKLKTVIRFIPAVLFLAFTIGMAVPTFLDDTVKDTIKETEVSFYGLEQLSDKFEGVLRENFNDKNEYVNLNGLTTRVLGINSLNEIQKLANGHLTGFNDAVDVSVSSENVIELNDFLNDRGIDFLYLLAPNKTAFYDAEFAPGYSSDYKDSFDSMINILDKAGVVTIDMNTWYEENGYTMDDVYYKTDHHWNPNGALAAAKETMEVLVEEDIIDNYDADLLEEESYNIVTKENWFLGSRGKRVGLYYDGLDDLNVYFPNFPTDYTFARLTKGTTNWHYDDSPLNLQYMEAEEPDYYGTDPHCTYLYGGEPLQICINNDARNDKTVLVIGDSFKRTWEYFMSSQFQKIYAIDNRESNYTDGSIVQFIEEIHPDIVFMCSNTPSNESYYSFGTDDYIAALESTDTDAEVIKLGDCKISTEGDSDSFDVLYSDLSPGRTYTLTLDSTYYSGDDESFVQMTLQDLSTNESVYNRYFDANSNETQKWIFTVPCSEDATGDVIIANADEDDNIKNSESIESDNEIGDSENVSNHVYAIYLYAGTKGHYIEPIEDGEDEEEGVGGVLTVEVENICIQEGIVED